MHNNMWNISGYQVNETVEVCSDRSWNAIATADNRSGDGAVKMYPNVHKDYHDWGTGYEPPLRDYPTLSSSFAATGPNTGIYHIAYEIWLNGVGQRRRLEPRGDDLDSQSGPAAGWFRGRQRPPARREDVDPLGNR